MSEIIGWLLAVYPDPEDGAVLWLIGEDGARLRLTQPFPTTFYAAGRDERRLQAVQAYLSRKKSPPEMTFTTRDDLFKGPRRVLAITVPNPIAQTQLYYDLQSRFRELHFYNARIPFAVRFGGETGAFPIQEHIPAALAIVYQAVADLYGERVPLEELVTRKRLAREPEEYTGQSEPAKAARQLRAAGIDVRVGQRIPMIYIKGRKPGVSAWGLPERPQWQQVDKARYRDLLIRSVFQVLQPLGMNEGDLASLVIGGGYQLALWPEEETCEGEAGDDDSLTDELFGDSTHTGRME